MGKGGARDAAERPNLDSQQLVPPVDGYSRLLDPTDSADASHDADPSRKPRGSCVDDETADAPMLLLQDGTLATLRAAAALAASDAPNTYVAPSGNVYSGFFLGFSVWESPRLETIALVEWAWFDRIVLLLIVLNCGLLAQQGPAPESEGPVALAMLYFQIAFTLEMALKVLASGFVANRSAYIRDPWNVLDAVVVASGWLPYLSPAASNLSAIRSMRALRPLRSIKRMPGVKALVGTMAAAATGLANVMVLCTFIFLVFGILGMQLFKGTLRYHCFAAGMAEPVDANAVCRPDAPELFCAPDEECRLGANPFNGAVSFDRIDSAFMTIFQIITLEGWTDVMYLEMDAVGSGACLYFLAVVVIGAFFLLNLFLAIICDKFEPPDRDEPDDASVASATERAHAAAAGLPPAPGGLARRLRAVVQSAAFQRVIVAVIVANTAVMCCYYYGMTARLERGLDAANAALSAVFAVEMALKLGGYGVRRYAADPFNLADAIVVLSSAVEVAVEWTGAAATGVNVSSLRALRLFRVLKLARAYPALRKVLSMMLRSLVELNSLFALMLLVSFVFALLGEQLFGLKLSPENGFGPLPPRANFDTMSASLLTVFIVMSGENWNEVYHDCFRAAPLAASAYFTVLVVVGNFVILNLIIAILINSIDHDHDDDGAAAGGASGALDGPTAAGDERFEDVEQYSPVEQRDRLAAAAAKAAAADGDGDGDAAGAAGTPAAVAATSAEAAAAALLRRSALPRPNSASTLAAAAVTISPRQSKLVRDLQLQRSRQAAEDADGDGWPCKAQRRRDHALGCLPPDARLRVWAKWLLGRAEFENVMIAIVVISSVAIAIEPLTEDDAATWRPRSLKVLADVNTGCGVLFVAEAAVKVVALGFLFPSTAYLRDPWNRLDALIVLTSLLEIVVPGHAFFKALRTEVRLLRPLRLIATHGGMKLIVNALLSTLPHVCSLMVICLLFLIVFGILGVQLFGGAFRACTDPAVATEAACVGDWAPPGGAEGLTAAREWLNPPFGSFDSLPAAALLLFEMQGLEGWPEVLFAGIDSVGPGAAPVRGHSTGSAAFFLLWIVVGSFFVLNLFIGVIVDTFNTIKRHEDGLLFMTAEQQQWVHAQYLMLKANAITRAARPAGGWRLALYDLVTHESFEPGVMALIVLNTACMAVDGYALSPGLAAALAGLNVVFVVAFTLEALLKMGAFTLGKYFANRWNVFDLLVVLGSLLDLFVSSSGVTLAISPTLLRVLRLFRVMRILRVIRSGEALRVLLHTLVQSLPSMSNVVVLLALLLFMFAVLGTHLFCKVKNGDFIDSHANFGSIFTALLTLFRCATGESWNGIMHDVMEGAGCGEAKDKAGCITYAAVPFFVAYTLTSTFVTLNIVIAIILDNFADSGSAYTSKLINDEHIDGFRVAWAEFDPDADQKIELRSLPALVLLVPRPLGLRGHGSATSRLTDCMKLIKTLNIRVHSPGPLPGEPASDWITYYETLDALVTAAFKAGDLRPDVDELATLSTSLANVEADKLKKKMLELTKTFARGGGRSGSGGSGGALSPDARAARAAPAGGEGGGGGGEREWLGGAAGGVVSAGVLYPVLRMQAQIRRSLGAKRERAQRTLRLDRGRGALAQMLPRTGASTLVVSSRLIVFGGRGVDGVALRDCWELQLGPGTWHDRSATVPAALEPRWGHSASLLSKARMLVTGGEGARGLAADVWELDTRSWRWTQLSSAPPAPRPAGAAPRRALEHAPLPRGWASRLRGLRESDGAVYAAVRIQRVWKGRLARVRVELQLRRVALEYFAAVLVQSRWRGARARRDFAARAATRLAPAAAPAVSTPPRAADGGVASGAASATDSPTRRAPRSEPQGGGTDGGSRGGSQTSRGTQPML